MAAVAVFAQMLIWLDGSIVNLVLPRLADPDLGLGATSAELEWLVSGYTLVFAALLLTGGAVCDRLGPRRALMIGLGILATASGWAAFAGSAGELIAARTGMGIGSALLMPSTLSMVIQGTAPAIRARAIALWSSSSGVGIALGPVVGGLLMTRFWWGSVFLINIPIAVMGIAAVLRFVPEIHVDRSRIMDITGLVLSFTGLLALVYGAIRAGQLVSLDQPEVLISLLCGGVILYAFAVLQAKVPQPSFDVGLFRVRKFAGGGVGLILAFFTLSGSLFFATLYLQGLKGLSPLAAGMIMLPAAFGVVLGAQASPGLVTRSGTRNVTTAGMLLNAVALGLFVLFDRDTSLLWFGLAEGLQGVGFGLLNPPTTSAMLADIPPARSGAGSAMIGVMRQVGSALGVAVLGSLLSVIYHRSIDPALAHIPAALAEQARSSVGATRFVAARLNDGRLSGAADAAFVKAMGVTAGCSAALALVGAVVVARTLRRSRRRRHRMAPNRRPRGRHPHSRHQQRMRS